MFESSYNEHLTRKSVQITYLCRFCDLTKVFFNRCRLLSHIRSHTFRTATIYVSDLNVEPIPLRFYMNQPIQNKNPPIIDLTKKNAFNGCYECKQLISADTGLACKDRASHFMQYTNEVHSCPVCLFTLPTPCGLRAHIRFHLNCPPFYCPECGVHLPVKKVVYPYSHDCEGFKMMRATARLKCPISTCHLYHPNDFRDHMKQKHLKKVFKCPFCASACFIEETMNVHLETHNIVEAKAIQFYQCELCPGRLVMQNTMESHLRTHIYPPVFPCWTCGSIFNEVCGLIEHYFKKHETNANIATRNALSSLINSSEYKQDKVIYRIVKRCRHCAKNFTYKCNINDISTLPNDCPFKCLSKLKPTRQEKTIVDMETLLTCHLCKEKISQNWNEIKKHYAKNHKNHKCVDPRLVLKKIDVAGYNKKRIRDVRDARIVTYRKHQQITKVNANAQDLANPVLPKVRYSVSDNYCAICKYTCESKEQLETHFLSHKDPRTAYQCMECGQSFVVKPSFSTHLMIIHGISNAEEYISNKNRCYNENALEKYQNSNISFEPLKDNQCKICRQQFANSEDLAKHFRGHGMAFLLKSTSNKNIG